MIILAVSSVARAAEILLFVSKQKCGSTLSDISGQLDIPKSTAFSIIRTLAEKNLLTITDTRRLTVVLGSGIYELAYNGMSSSDIYSIVQPELSSLSAELKKSSAFYLFNETSYSMLCTCPYIGTPYPNISAGESTSIKGGLYGPLCLAYSEIRKAEEFIQELQVEEAERFRTRMTLVRQRGYDIVACDHSSELYSLAVSVQNTPWACFGFLCVYLLNPDLNASFTDMVKAIQHTAVHISNRISFLH